MALGEAFGPLVGAVALGALHGVEPGHGWPVAASYALDRSNKWLYGLAAGLLIGVGHLVSSLAMVAAFLYARDYFGLGAINDPVVLPGGLAVGGPVGIVAGVVLIALGLREYRHGHSHSGAHGFGGHRHDGDEHGPTTPSEPDRGHSHASDHGHSHASDHGHGHHRDGFAGADVDHRTAVESGPRSGVNPTRIPRTDQGRDEHESTEDDEASGGILDSLVEVLPIVGGHHHAEAPDSDRGLIGIAWFAFVLGFAHEEEFEILALCAGSAYCLELMVAYALTVVAGIVGLTLLLIAGYERYETRLRRYSPYLPTLSAAILIAMGLGFALGLF